MEIGSNADSDIYKNCMNKKFEIDQAFFVLFLIDKSKIICQDC